MHYIRIHVVLLMLLFIALLLAGCGGQETSAPDSSIGGDDGVFTIAGGKVMLGDTAGTEDVPVAGPEHGNGGRLRLLQELLAARQATERYRDINRAIADGYADINVIMPHMGFHYMKSALVDAQFNPRRPEILVYNTLREGHPPRLVAVEYAVPLTLSQNAPEGFTGGYDVWQRNETFGLWLLHAWVWYPNPDGVFNPTNPIVP